MASSMTSTRVAGASGRMLVVAAIHVGAGLMITQGLKLDLGLDKEPPPITATVDPKQEPIVEPSPPSAPPFVTPRIIDFVEPLVRIDEPTEDADSGLLTPPQVEEGTAGSAGDLDVPPAPRIVAVRSDARHPLSQPPYPPAAIRMGEEGVGVVRVWVLPTGRVGEARIERSTGSSRLDAAALEEARRWRLLPATRNGVAFADWYSVRVVFRLDQR